MCSRAIGVLCDFHITNHQRLQNNVGHHHMFKWKVMPYFGTISLVEEGLAWRFSISGHHLVQLPILAITETRWLDLFCVYTQLCMYVCMYIVKVCRTLVRENFGGLWSFIHQIYFNFMMKSFLFYISYAQEHHQRIYPPNLSLLYVVYCMHAHVL